MKDTRDDTTMAIMRKKGTADVRKKALTEAETRAATEATKEDRMIMALVVNKVVVSEEAKRAMALDVSNTVAAVKTIMALAVNKVAVMEAVKMFMALNVSKVALVTMEAANMSVSRVMEVEETFHKVAGKCSHLWSLISANLN